MNKLRAVISTVAIAVVMTVTAQAEDKAEKNISFDNNGLVLTYQTNAETLGEFLETVDDAVVESYIINDDLNTVLGDENLFQIEQKVNVKIMLNDGEPIRLKHESGVTVGEIIEDLETQNPGKTYYYEAGELDKPITDDYILHFKSGEVEVVKEQKPIAFTTTKIESDELYVGETEVVTEGVDGLKEIEVTKHYFNGEVVERTEKELDVIQEPVTEVILVGTKKRPTFELGKKTDIENLDYSKKITMNSTAYSCDGRTAKTASGRTAQVGVVAVDTSVIPFGTKLYIEGYGYAVAGDTGGAIKGNKLDLYMNTTQECLNFGRRNVDVYILN